MKRARGNILFLILLAVVLFAALAYAVTSSMRGGGKDVTDEQAKLQAAQLLQHISMLENHITRMLMFGVRKEQLDFYAPGVTSTANTANTNCAGNACRVFATNGGELNWSAIDGRLKDPNWAGFSNQVSYVNSSGGITPFINIMGFKHVGTDAPELILYAGYLNRKVCEELNIQLGVMQKGEAIPMNTHGILNAAYKYMAGNVDPWPTDLTVGMMGFADARIAGKRGVCTGSFAATHGYTFYYVLLEV